IQEVLKVLLALAGIAYYIGRPQSDTGEALPQKFYELLAPPFAIAPHTDEDIRVAVLQWYIQVFTELAGLGHCLDKLLIDVVRITVEQAQPAYLLNLIQFPE